MRPLGAPATNGRSPAFLFFQVPRSFRALRSPAILCGGLQTTVVVDEVANCGRGSFESKDHYDVWAGSEPDSAAVSASGK